MAMSASQLVAMAMQTARVPSGWAQLAGQMLNLIQSDLCETYELDVNRKTYTGITLQAGNVGPYELPADYLRAYINDVFFTQLGVPYKMFSVELSEFDGYIQQSGNQGYPDRYATDMSQSPPQMFVYVAPNGAYPLTIRYQRAQPDITTPEVSATIPWFPNQDYLHTRLAAELMKVADDERCTAFLGYADEILRRYLRMKDDQTTRTPRVSLDPRNFGPRDSRLPSTKSVSPLD